MVVLVESEALVSGISVKLYMRMHVVVVVLYRVAKCPSACPDAPQHSF